MTIEDIFSRGEISIHTWNVCINNQIRTFEDLKRHYMERDSYSNLRLWGAKSYDELIGVLFKYKDLYNENIATPPVSKKRSEVKLEDVVTDHDEVIRSNIIADASLKRIELKLKDYWRSKAGKKNRRVDSTQIGIKKPSVKVASKKDAIDLKSIEQRLEKYWNEIEEKKALQDKKRSPTVKAIFNVTDVVDLDDIEHTLKQYWKDKGTPDKINIVDLEELEQKLQDYWREQDCEEATDRLAP